MAGVSQLTDSLTVSAFTGADGLRGRDAYGINHHKQKKSADEYTSSEKVLIDAVGAKHKVNRVSQR